MFESTGQQLTVAVADVVVVVMLDYLGCRFLDPGFGIVRLEVSVANRPGMWGLEFSRLGLVVRTHLEILVDWVYRLLALGGDTHCRQ